jgi:hypothetical protein
MSNESIESTNSISSPSGVHECLARRLENGRRHEREVRSRHHAKVVFEPECIRQLTLHAAEDGPRTLGRAIDADELAKTLWLGSKCSEWQTAVGNFIDLGPVLTTNSTHR